MTNINRDRPPIDYLGPYNIDPSELDDEEDEIWLERENLEELSLEEFFEVHDAVFAALSKHGRVYELPDDDHDFFLYDDMFFDRTQKIELEPSDRLSTILPGVVAELQRVLQEHPLWRVMFLGDGDEHQARENFFVVYPDVVRIRQLQSDGSVEQALVENAELRLRVERGSV